MPQDSTPRQAVFSVCPVCKGTRFSSRFVACRECRGLGRYALIQNEILVWDYGLDALHIVLRRWNRTVKLWIDGFLVALLALNIFLVYRSGTLVEFQYVDWLNLIFLSNEWVIGPIWIIAVFNLYLLFRLYHQLTSKKGKLQYDTRTKEGEKVNIAEYLHPSVATLFDEVWPYAQRNGQLPIRSLQLFGVMFENQDILMILTRLALPEELLLDALRRQIAYYPPLKSDDALSPDVQNIMLNAYLITREARATNVRITDVFLATILADEKIQEILYHYKVDLVKVTNVITWINFNNMLRERYQHYRARSVYKPKGPVNRSYTAAATPFLDSFSTDLTQLARSGQLPLTVARDKEVQELFRVMEGGKSVVLVGEEGVGKGNIIEGLANRMAAEDVPPMFQDKRLVSLSLPFLVAGAGRTGEVQERLLLVIQEVLRSGNIILVIENIDNLVGVSSAGTENLDLSEVLSQEIQNHGVWVISTSTPRKVTEFIEGSALMGVLERVPVLEPNKNQTIQILESHVGGVEAQHKVFFTYESLERIVDLSDRYLHNQFLPAKAINLMAEAGSWIAQRESKVISGEDIAALVSRKTNIPLTQVSAQESTVLMNLEQIMHERIVGQDEAVNLVVSALRRSRAELRDEKRPISNLLFLGPTGVGKTELAKTVAASYFGKESAMTRLDMSEYQNQDSIARLIGVPGSNRGGVLTEAIRANPFTVLLLDEIEKAHPDILNIFLQVMDDGRLTDALGRTIDFTNVILIATSNAGANFIQDEVLKNTPVEKIKDSLLRGGILRDIFRPEFLNRFDGIVVFKPLTRDEILQVAGLMLKGVAKRLAAKGITLTVTQEAQEELARTGYDPIFGARPLRRVIQDQVDNALANYLLKGEIDRRDEVVLDTGGRISVKKAQAL